MRVENVVKKMETFMKAITLLLIIGIITSADQVQNSQSPQASRKDGGFDYATQIGILVLNEVDILQPPNAKALWRGIPGLPPGRFSVLRKRILACSPKGLPVPSALFFSRHFYLDGSQARISSSDRSSSPA